MPKAERIVEAANEPGLLGRFSSRNLLRALGILAMLALPVLVLLPGAGAFPYPPAAETAYSDLAVSHYPYAIALRRAIFEQHSLPLWSPNILSGHPLAANPLAGMWYPPGWFALLLPLPFGFNLSVALHLLWGGVGAFLLHRQGGLSRRAGILGALAFVAMPKLFAHYGAGHVTMLYAIPWTPWLLWAAGSKWKPGRMWLQAAILALIFTADPRWALYAGGLWWAYSLFALTKDIPDLWQRSFVRIRSLFGQSILGALLAAPLWLPMLEFTRLSSRVSMAPEDVFAFSLPASRLIGFLFPDFGGFHEWVNYPGVVLFALTVTTLLRTPNRLDGISFSKRMRAWWMGRCAREKFWLIIFLGALLFSLGDNIPLLPALANLPLFNLLRAPSRALFLVGLAIAASAAHGVDDLLSRVSLVAWRKTLLGLFALTLFSLSIFGMTVYFTGEVSQNFAWGAGFMALAALWIGLIIRKSLPENLWFLGLVILCIIDWGAVDYSLFTSRPPALVLAEGREVVEYLADQDGVFRVYSPSYSVPQQTAALAGLQLADGVDPLQLQAYVAFMRAATGVPGESYSVTMPPFETGEPARANVGYLPDARLLGLLNVRYIVAEFDLAVDGLVNVSWFGNSRLYQNVYALPRAWVQPFNAPIGDDVWPVISLSNWPNRITIQAEGPGLLVLSELAYPGWQARIDGRPAELQTAAGLLRAVDLEPGSHEIVFLFLPKSLMTGLVIGLMALAFIIFWSWRVDQKAKVSGDQ